MTLSIQLDPEKYHSRLKEYFKNATEWGSIFVPNDSPKKIIKNAINLKNRFLNYDEIVLQMLNEDSNLVLFGRRGTGKTTYVTYSFFERLEAFDENSGLFPVYVNLNLMNPSIASIDILTSYFFVVLIQSVLKSVQIYWQYTSNKGIFEKLAKNFKKSIFGGLEKYVDKDLIEEIENIFKLTTETQSNEDDEEDQKDLENYLKSRDDFNKKLNLIFKQKQILVNYDTFYLISDRILSTLNASGFILYIDEVSEFFVSREKEGQHLAMIPVFLDFVQNIVTLNEKKYFLKLVLYQREDLDYIYCRAKREPDIKGWSYCTLDIYQNTEEMVKRKAEEKKKIKKIYQDLIKEKIFYFLVKGCDDEENTLMNQLEKIEGNVNDYKKFETNVLKNIFQDYEKNSLNIFYLLNFSTGGAIRELAFILKDALTREQGIPLIQLDNIRLAISTRYNSRRDESKEVKLFETVMLEKFKNKENQLFFLEKIQDDFLPNQQEIARALSKLEQNFLINFVSDKIEGIYKVYCYHPGFANSQDNFYACLQLKVDQKASLTIFSKRDLWRNYFDEIKEEEKQNDNLIFKQHFDAIVEYLDKNQEFALLQKLKDMEEFINFEGLQLFCNRNNINYGELIFDNEEEESIQVIIKPEISRQSEQVEVQGADDIQTEEIESKIATGRNIENWPIVKKLVFEEKLVWAQLKSTYYAILECIYLKEAPVESEITEYLYLKSIPTDRLYSRFIYLENQQIIERKFISDKGLVSFFTKEISDKIEDSLKS